MHPGPVGSYTKGVVDETRIGGDGREFPATRWTLIASSREAPEKKQAALDELLRIYWKPLYFYVRRKGHSIESAKDIIQGFYTHLLERDFLARLDPGKGRFRAYLRASLDNYLANLHESLSAQKRGGGAKNVALDFDVAESGLPQAPENAEAAFDREWALGVMERALAELRKEFEQGRRGGPFDVVLKFFQLDGAPTYEEAAKLAGMSVPQFKAFLHRTRTRFRQLVRQQVAQTVSTDGDADAEISELIRALKS